LRRLVVDAVAAYWDPEVSAAVLEREQRERQALREFAETWTGTP
jgi:hypothetical protein